MNGRMMVIFATPDFGAGAYATCIMLSAWLVAVALAAAAVASGAKLLKSQSPRWKRVGWPLVLSGASVPLLCCVGPPSLIRVVYGNFPITGKPYDKVKEGMSAEEVIAAIGTPHERYKGDDGERWYYWCDSYGIGWFCVRFRSDGRVEQTYGD